MGRQWKQCQTLFLWVPKSLQMVTATMKLKDAYPHPGRGRPSLWLPEPLRPRKTTRRRNWIRAFVEDPKTGTASNAGPAPYRAAGSLSSVDGKAQTPLCGASPVWPEQASAPHTQRHLPAAPALPAAGLNWTSEPKRSPPPACVRAEIRHRRDGKQKPNKQREALQKVPVQQDKIPEGNTVYTGRGL